MNRCLLLLFSIMSVGSFVSNVPHQLFGEWSVWHSHTPVMKGSNKLIVGIYPNSHLEVIDKKTIGPCILEKVKIGKYTFTENENKTTELKLNANDNDEYEHQFVDITFERKDYYVRSIFGIGLDNLPIRRSTTCYDFQKMSLYFIGKEDLFLTFTVQGTEDNEPKTLYDGNDNVLCYHLVRNIRTKEPSINVPLSTLIATHMTSIFFNYILMHLFHIMN